MSTRIIAGEKRGFPIQIPKSGVTRPTLGRVRESLFMILMPWLPEGAHVLDVYAGSGSLGLEALSRGAGRAVFVENSRSVLPVLRGNIAKLGWRDRATMIVTDARGWLKQGPNGRHTPFDLIFLDPPYGRGMCARGMEYLGENPAGWLDPDGIVVAQAGLRDPLEPAYGDLIAFREETYSETRIVFYRLRTAQPSARE